MMRGMIIPYGLHQYPLGMLCSISDSILHSAAVPHRNCDVAGGAAKVLQTPIKLPMLESSSSLRKHKQ